MQYESIDRKNIRMLMDRFYSAVLKEEVLADFFIEALGDEMITDEWQEHLNRLTDFWASLTLADNSYQGQPIKAHLHLEGLSKKHFEAWLALFFTTTQRVYAPETAKLFQDKSKIIAENFIKILKL